MEPTGGGGYVLKADPSVKAGAAPLLCVLPRSATAGCSYRCQHISCSLPALRALLPSQFPCFFLLPSPVVQVTSRAHKMSKSRGAVIHPDDVVCAAISLCCALHLFYRHFRGCRCPSSALMHWRTWYSPHL